MKCTKCNVDLAENYSICPLCSSEAVDEPNELQGLKVAPYSKATPTEEKAPKAKRSFSLEKIKAYFNL